MARKESRSPLLPLESHTGKVLSDDTDLTDVEELRESLHKGLLDARNKISSLRSELGNKQRAYEEERQLRESAEKELAAMSRMSPGREINKDASISPMDLATDLESPIRHPRSLNNAENENFDRMLEELRAAKNLNRTLTEKLSQAEKELLTSIKSKEDMQLEMEASVAARGAALVDKIYTAQKQKDQAVLARMKLLTAERDELLNTLHRHLKERTSSGLQPRGRNDDASCNPDDMSISELLQNVLSSNRVDEIERLGESLVDRVSKAHKSNVQHLSDENRCLREERDRLKAEVARLAEEVQELQQIREASEIHRRKTMKDRIKSMQVQLKTVVEQRDTALQRVTDLEAQLEKARIAYSLNKSLNQEDALRQQFNTTVDDFESSLQEKEQRIGWAQHAYDDLVNKHNSLIREKRSLAQQLQDTINQSKEDKKRADKLERLVEVLRRRKGASPNETIG